MTKLVVECCANSIESAINGQKGGTNRIELCTELESGGITPLHKEITLAKSLLNIPIFVLIRPRKGNFIYTEKEFQQIISDIEFCKKSGCEGVVIGSLNLDGSINKEQTSEMVKIAKPMEVTFHRAFDESKDIENDLNSIISCGCDRLLTSGKEENVELGYKNLKKIIQLSEGRIKVMAGSGVSHTNIEKLYNIGIREFHLSGKIKNNDGKIETSEELIRLAVSKTKTLA